MPIDSPTEPSLEDMPFSVLAGHIAHEINNPLEYITNYLFLLSESLPPDVVKKGYLQKIEKGIGNLAALTKDLLDLSRMDNAEFSAKNIHRIIDQSLEPYQTAFVRENVALRREYHARDCAVLCSEEMLRQVFGHIIQNALDAMSKAVRTLSIKTFCKKGVIKIAFADTGAGIPERNLDKVFAPFFTTKKSIDKRGTGLGLTLCYNFIRRHHGMIHIASPAGKGATVTITLPVLPRGT